MIDVFIFTRRDRFLGFVPRQAIWDGRPSVHRLLEIEYEYPVMPDGWIYRRIPTGTARKSDRFSRWKKW